MALPVPMDNCNLKQTSSSWAAAISNGIHALILFYHWLWLFRYDLDQCCWLHAHHWRKFDSRIFQRQYRFIIKLQIVVHRPERLTFCEISIIQLMQTTSFGPYKLSICLECAVVNLDFIWHWMISHLSCLGAPPSGGLQRHCSALFPHRLHNQRYALILWLLSSPKPIIFVHSNPLVPQMHFSSVSQFGLLRCQFFFLQCW